MKPKKYNKYLAIGLKEWNEDKQLKESSHKEIRNILFSTLISDKEIKVTSTSISRSVMLYHVINKMLFTQLNSNCENKFPTLELANGSCVCFETNGNV